MIKIKTNRNEYLFPSDYSIKYSKEKDIIYVYFFDFIFEIEASEIQAIEFSGSKIEYGFLASFFPETRWRDD